MMNDTHDSIRPLPAPTDHWRSIESRAAVIRHRRLYKLATAATATVAVAGIFTVIALTSNSTGKQTLEVAATGVMSSSAAPTIASADKPTITYSPSPATTTESRIVVASRQSDVDGDGRADVVEIDQVIGQGYFLYVRLATGVVLMSDAPAGSQDITAIHDVNNDGLKDVFVQLSGGAMGSGGPTVVYTVQRQSLTRVTTTSADGNYLSVSSGAGESYAGFKCGSSVITQTTGSVAADGTATWSSADVTFSGTTAVVGKSYGFKTGSRDDLAAASVVSCG